MTIEPANLPDPARRGAAPRPGRPLPPFPTMASVGSLADRVDATNPADALPRLLLLAQDRAAFYGELLRAQIEHEGMHGIVGRTFVVSIDGERVETGEKGRALAKLESDERDRAAELTTTLARLKISPRVVQTDTARTVTAAIRALLAEVGLPETEDTMHAARRAVFAGRRAAGIDDGDPDLLVGLRLDAATRARVLRAATEAAEREAAALEGVDER